MIVEESLIRRAARHAALGEPVRLRICDALALGDASPGEIARQLDLSSNLLAHHLGVLESAGVVVRTRSEADQRRTYVRLTQDARPFVNPRLARDVVRVVFVCTQNSARSQLAAALWASRTGVPVASAGTHPARAVHPRAVAVARRHNLDLGKASTTHLRDVVRPDDFVIAVCDLAYEEIAHGGSVQAHWSIPDPARKGTHSAFSEALDSLDERVRVLANVVDQDRNR
jgi:protein-tyrosine-phosphatase